MRLRLRPVEGGTTSKVEVPAACTLGELRASVVATIGSAQSHPPNLLQFSLNKQELLQGAPCDSLRSLGVSGGDLLWFTAVQESSTNAARATVSTLAEPSAQRRTGAEPAPTGASSEVVTRSDCQPGAVRISQQSAATVAAPSMHATAISPEADGPPSPVGVLEDSTLPAPSEQLVPDYLQRVLQSCQPPQQPIGALVLFVHAVLLESGLRLQSQEHGNEYALPPDWHLAQGAKTLHYTLKAARPQEDQPHCTLSCALLGDFLLLAAAAGTTGILQLTLPLRQHVQVHPAAASALNGASAVSAPGLHFPHQQALWAQIKDTLVLPIKTALCRAAGQPLPLSLLLLPCELRDRCLSYLLAEDLAHVSLVCTELRYAASSNQLWRPLLERLSPSHVPAGSEEDARTSFKAIYGSLVSRMQRERDAKRRVLPRWQPHLPAGPHLVQPPPPGFVPGIVGGDYDRLPFLSGPSSLGGLPLGGIAGRGGARGAAGLFGTSSAFTQGSRRSIPHWRLG